MNKAFKARTHYVVFQHLFEISLFLDFTYSQFWNNALG